MPEDQGRCELAIIGAGVVGCALAQAIASLQTRSQGPIWLLEGAAQAGTGVSSRNSGVVHAGLYYRPGSRKARSCVAGNALIWDWVARRGVAHRRTGKLVVASEDAQVPGLDALLANAEASGALLERVELSRARALEPNLPPTILAACWSPSSGIVDVHGLVRSLLADAEDAGVTFLPSAPVTGIELRDQGFRLSTPRGVVLARQVINAAGLGAVAIARALGLERRSFAARGDYFRLRKSSPWRRLIYPVTPVTPAGTSSASLGIHLTLELDGGCRLGPDLDWVEDPTDFSPARGEAKHATFLAAARRLLGPIVREDLRYDGCGIRPKLHGPGEPVADFEIIEHPRGCWHLLGIESPGLTASLALAAELCARADGPLRRP